MFSVCLSLALACDLCAPKDFKIATLVTSVLKFYWFGQSVSKKHASDIPIID